MGERRCSAAAYAKRGLSFGKHSVAVTGEGSLLDRHAIEEGFLARFPMWDWVGGRTSETGPVGLLPAALQGIAVKAPTERLKQRAQQMLKVQPAGAVRGQKAGKK